MLLRAGLLPMNRRRAAQHEQELPGNRVEIPHPVGNRCQVPTQVWRQQVHRHRPRHHPPGFAQEQRQHQRQAGQQHDIQGQRVHQVGLEAQQQFIHQRLLWLGDKVRQAHLLHQIAGFHMAVGEEHDAHQHRQQENMHHVKHPGAPQDLQAGHPVAFALQDLAIGQH